MKHESRCIAYQQVVLQASAHSSATARTLLTSSVDVVTSRADVAREAGPRVEVESGLRMRCETATAMSARKQTEHLWQP